ncbi:alpha/beta hydrolase family protein [Profundibacter sp.]
MKRIIKTAIIAVIASAALIGAYVAVKSADIAPTHASLKNADLAPLIAVRDFYANSDSEWGYAPSVGAKYISYWATQGGDDILIIRDVTRDKIVLTLTDVGFSNWHAYEPYLLAYVDNRYWQIDPQDSDRDNWVDITPRGFTNWRISSIPQSPDDHILISSRDRNPAFSDIYTVNQRGGDKQLLYKNEGETKDWLVDGDFTAYFRTDFIDDSHDQIMRKDGDGWVALFSVEQDDGFAMIELDSDKKGFSALSARGRDRMALVHVDGMTGQEQVLVSNDNVDITSFVNFDATNGGIDAVYVDEEHESIVPISARARAFVGLLEQIGGPADVNILAMADQGRFMTIAISVKEKSFQYYLFDLVEKTKSKLGDFAFRKHKDAMAQTEMVWFTASDGLEIPAFLTRPIGASGPAPLIVNVHGGPASRVIWQYDHDLQFLVNRGYAVLSVNFRGSTGYGRAFQQAGYGEYGDRVQDDLVDGANWAVAQGIADKDAMAIIGASFGGYSAARVMTRQSSPFKVAIIEHAVLDLPYQMANNPASWGLNAGNFIKYFEDIDAPEIQEKLRDRSPITHVDRLQGPVLLIAGKLDKIVGFEQTEDFARAVEAADKPIRVAYFADEGHGVRGWIGKVQRARELEDFLAEHLGGRSGNWDYIEVAAEY